MTVRTSRPNAPEDILVDIDSSGRRTAGSLESFSTAADCIFSVSGNRPALKLYREA